MPGTSGLTARAAVLLPLTSLFLRWRGAGFCLRAAQRRLDRARIPTLSADRQREAALAVIDAVERADLRFSVVAADCLPRSIVAWYLARRLGCEVDLRLGVRTLMGRFEAHAWVELDGEALGEVEDVANIYAEMDLDRLRWPLDPS